MLVTLGSKENRLYSGRVELENKEDKNLAFLKIPIKRTDSQACLKKITKIKK